MNKSIVSILSIFLLLHSCNQDNKITSVYFDLEQPEISLFDTSIISDYEIIKLETSREARIGSIDKVIVADSLIFILDQFQAKAVFIFDKSGKYISKIARFGRGHNEYLQLFDFDYDSDKQTIDLLSRVPSKIMTIDIKHDSVVNSVDLTRNFVQFLKQNQNYLAFQGNVTQEDDNNICLLDSSGNVLNSWIEIEPGWESTFNNSSVLTYGNDKSICFLQPHTNFMYKLAGNELVPYMQLDFGKYNMPPSVKSFTDYQKTTKNFIEDIDMFHETETYWFFYYILNGSDYVSLFNKKSGETILAHPAKDDHTKYFLPFGKIKSFSGNNLITTIDADEMQLYLTGKNEYNDFTQEYAEGIQRLRLRIGHVNDDDNPLIVIYNLK